MDYLEKDEEFKAILWDEAESMKVTLGNLDEVSSTIKFMGKVVAIDISKDDIEDDCLPILDEIERLITKVMKESEKKGHPIRYFCKVGACSRFVPVGNRIDEIFGNSYVLERNGIYMSGEYFCNKNINCENN